jgi:hypothetical protein
MYLDPSQRTVGLNFLRMRCSWQEILPENDGCQENKEANREAVFHQFAIELRFMFYRPSGE